MCGIAGLFGDNISRSTLSAMLDVAKRRGSEGILIRKVHKGFIGHAALGFVNEGNNPQPLAEGNNSLVYNGEIYNWQAINKKYQLGAENDTATLLRGLMKIGWDFLKEIDGQFAFIVQCKKKNMHKTFLGRDRYGISPLAFGFNSMGHVVVGSTAETVAQAGVLDIRTVPAGSWGEIKESDVNLNYWFRFPVVSPEEETEKQAGDMYVLAKNNVIARIPSKPEVLFTTLGGMDSGSVTTLVTKSTKGKFGVLLLLSPGMKATLATNGAVIISPHQSLSTH